LPRHYNLPDAPCLAYVEWFTRLGAPDPVARMYKISKASRNGCRHASIIPVSWIVQSTHLTPVWLSSGVKSTWTRDNIYDEAKTFFVNPALRPYDFVRFEKALALAPWPSSAPPNEA
jgi:hypothetical protein